MTDDQHKMIQELRAQGYAVSLMTPDELQGVKARDIENVMVREANEAVEILKPYPDTQVA